jgi:hypothetical protein
LFGSHGKEAASTNWRKLRKASKLKTGTSWQRRALQYAASNIHSGKVAVVSSGSRT